MRIALPGCLSAWSQSSAVDCLLKWSAGAVWRSSSISYLLKFRQEGIMKISYSFLCGRGVPLQCLAKNIDAKADVRVVQQRLLH